jgi:hypothetical protein
LAETKDVTPILSGRWCSQRSPSRSRDSGRPVSILRRANAFRGASFQGWKEIVSEATGDVGEDGTTPEEMAYLAHTAILDEAFSPKWMGELSPGRTALLAVTPIATKMVRR